MPLRVPDLGFGFGLHAQKSHLSQWQAPSARPPRPVAAEYVPWMPTCEAHMHICRKGRRCIPLFCRIVLTKHWHTGDEELLKRLHCEPRLCYSSRSLLLKVLLLPCKPHVSNRSPLVKIALLTKSSNSRKRKMCFILCSIHQFNLESEGVRFQYVSLHRNAP